MTAMAAALDAPPKVELHCHVEGTMRPATLLDLARRNSVPLPTTDPTELYRYRSLDGLRRRSAPGADRVDLDLGREYAAVADAFGWSWQEMVEISLDGVEACWVGRRRQGRAADADRVRSGVPRPKAVSLAQPHRCEPSTRDSQSR